jgi:hypothetical protein
LSFNPLTCAGDGVPFDNHVCIGASGQCVTTTPTATRTNTSPPTLTRTPTSTPTLTPDIPASVDPYKCYRIKSTALYTKKEVKVFDQFGNSVTTTIKPFFFCNPAVQTAASAMPATSPTPKHPEAALVCYKLKDDNRIPATATRVQVRNNLDPTRFETYEILKSQLICMPSVQAKQ